MSRAEAGGWEDGCATASVPVANTAETVRRYKPTLRYALKLLAFSHSTRQRAAMAKSSTDVTRNPVMATLSMYQANCCCNGRTTGREAIGFCARRTETVVNERKAKGIIRPNLRFAPPV